MDPFFVLFIIVAGIADGFNPCSFAGLLVFASVTTASFQQVASCHDIDPEGATFKRSQMVRYGVIWILALFVTYSVVGFGFLGAIRLILVEGHLAGKAAAIGSIIMGLWMVRDYLTPKARLRLEPSKHMKRLTGKYLRVLTYPGIFAAGILVGLCTIPCSGGIYLSIMGMILTQEQVVGYLLLVLYNFMFVLPLIIVLWATTNRKTYLTVARWHVRRRAQMKLVLAGIMLALGFFTLFVLT